MPICIYHRIAIWLSSMARWGQQLCHSSSRSFDIEHQSCPQEDLPAELTVYYSTCMHALLLWQACFVLTNNLIFMCERILTVLSV